jgi:hypothetical protein
LLRAYIWESECELGRLGKGHDVDDLAGGCADIVGEDLDGKGELGVG